MVEQRLWAFLVGLGRRHGVHIGTGCLLLRIGLTRADLAPAINVSAKSVEAALQRLRAQGKLSTGYKEVVLHQLPTEEELDRSFWSLDVQRADPNSLADIRSISTRPSGRPDSNSAPLE